MLGSGGPPGPLWSAVPLVLAALAGCGGQSTRHEEDGSAAGATGSGATGGSGGAGGSSAAGGSGGKSQGCVVDESFYEVGTSFPAGDGCNTCTCQDAGSVVCTRTFCEPCGEPVSCGACADEPLRGVCGADSFCADSYTEPTP